MNHKGKIKISGTEPQIFFIYSFSWKAPRGHILANYRRKPKYKTKKEDNRNPEKGGPSLEIMGKKNPKTISLSSLINSEFWRSTRQSWGFPNPWTWHIFPFVCVIFNFFHQYFLVFRVPVFSPPRLSLLLGIFSLVLVVEDLALLTYSLYHHPSPFQNTCNAVFILWWICRYCS